MSHKGKLIIVSGPSGVGKGTILKQLYSQGEFPLCTSVSATTRSKRPGEKNGVDYHFLTRDEFERRKNQGDFLECFEVFTGGDWYGTLKETVDQALRNNQWLVLEIDVKGARRVLKEYPDAITVFIMPPDRETLQKRLEGRGTESPEALKKRLATAEEEIKQSDWYRHRIFNDRIEDAVEQFRKILHEENHD